MVKTVRVSVYVFVSCVQAFLSLDYLFLCNL